MASAAAFAQSKVYLTRDISPESLVKIYKAVGVPAKGRVAVKMSTGEGSNPNYLKPELVKNLVFEVDGTIVECNTAYGNAPADKKDDRNTSENHWKVIERHGFTKYFPVDIMDEYDEMRIPVKDRTHIKYDIVGGHMAHYDFMVTAKNDPTDLLKRIDKQHGIHTIEHAAKIGLGSRQYQLISIDK